MAKNVRFFRVPGLPAVELYRTANVSANTPRHIHWVFSLTVVEAGRRIHETRQGRYPYRPGSIVVVNVGELHSIYCPDDCQTSSQSIRIDPALLTAMLQQVSGRPQDAVSLRQPVIEDPLLYRRILQLCDSLSNPVSQLEKEYLLLEVFASLYGRHSREVLPAPAPGNERTPVVRVCEYLQDCYNENVSLQRLGELAGLSEFHLARVFCKHTGVPPHTYQAQIRLKKATDLLAAGKPIAEVAAETGFCDQSHFNRIFKKKFGITPGQYEWRKP